MTRQITWKGHHLLIPVLLLTGIWLGLLAHQGRLAAFGIYGSRLACVVMFVLSLSAVGFLVLPKPHRKPVLCFTTGMIVYYYLLFLLGIFHLYIQWILVALFYLPGLYRLLRNKNAALQRLWNQTYTLEWLEVALVLAGYVVVFYSFLISLNPVIHYDALTNHLAIPAEYLMRQGIESIPYNLHANLPPASHMIHLILIASAGGDSVQIFHFVVMLFVLLALWDLTPNRFVWLCASLIFLLIPQVSLLFSLTNIDFLTTLFCVTSLLLARDPANPKPLLLGSHLAFLLSLKYQSVLFVFLILLFLLWKRQRKSFVVTSVITVLLIVPFLIKNYFYTKDPFFPFFYETFPSSSITVAEVRGFVQANESHGGAWDLAGYLQTIWSCLTKQPETGFLILIVLVVALSFRRISFQDKSWMLVFFAFPLFMLALVSFNVVNIIRWIQPSWLFLALLGGVCLAYWVQRRKILPALFLLWLVGSFYVCFQFNLNLTRSIFVATGRMSEEQYRTVYIPSYTLRNRLSRLPGTVLFVGDSRGFYNVENCVIPAAYNYLWLQKYFDGAHTVEELRENFKKSHVEYLFINRREVMKNIQKGRYAWMQPAYFNLLRELSNRSDVIGNDGESIIVRL